MSSQRDQRAMVVGQMVTKRCIQLSTQVVVSLRRRRFISVHPQLKRPRFTLGLRMMFIQPIQQYITLMKFH